MKRVRNYILSQNKDTVGLNEISAELSLTKKEVSAELLQFLEDTLKNNPDGLTITDLKEKTKLNRNWIAKQLEILELLGRVELKTIGPAKLYRWSEEGLNKWEKYYRALIENSHDVIIVIQKRSQQSMQIQFISDSIEQITGITAGEFDEERVTKHIHPDDRSIIESLDRIFANETVQDTINFRFLDKWGKYHYIEAAITDLRDKPEIGGLVLNCQDVTETFILQQQIQYRIAFEQILLNISTTLITTPEFDLVHRLSENFNAIGKFMQPSDHLENLNFIADYLFLSVFDSHEQKLRAVTYWNNLEEFSNIPKSFLVISTKEHDWLIKKIVQKEPVFYSPIKEMWSKLDDSMKNELKSIDSGSFLAIPFQSADSEILGAIIIFFHTALKASSKDQFLDLFQNLAAIFVSHLKRIEQSSQHSLEDLFHH
ncbi:PAS domain S-box protein [Candidatus Harpocratesius sp.]